MIDSLYVVLAMAFALGLALRAGSVRDVMCSKTPSALGSVRIAGSSRMRRSTFSQPESERCSAAPPHPLSPPSRLQNR